MSHDQQITYAILSLVAVATMCIGIRCWRNAKGATSIYAQDERFEDIGMTLLSSLFQTAPVKLGDGRIELRPPMGLILIAPFLALVFTTYTDFGPLWESLGIASGWIRDVIYYGLAAVFCYSWFMLLFVQKVIYSDKQITCHGVDLRSQTRDLDDLVGIRVHEKRPALVLTFERQKPLYIPKFLSHRAQFVSAMEKIAAQNTRDGMVARPTSRQNRMGF
ncbi:hypothetical protein ROA7450_04035 [Roseovarius albus]|uniref:Uncharacterized protein n=1 Tax=Roseovarius albus TaxID=1247867 RepID=A0A1X7A7G3_9RHOB|nr:hypothetical protein [Roseovarius albus]SLN72359.1 hypothetical protein ROA7450_04035 [Roseovarius albus]